MAETPSIRDAVQASENACKNSFLNYESPALTAELQARVLGKLRRRKDFVEAVPRAMDTE
jgi:hypothetical protein